jgi:hypothetical protein
MEFLRTHPEHIDRVFAPLTDAGFKDFKFAGLGLGTAFFITAVDGSSEDRIVFRVSSEAAKRKENCPFFLCSPFIEEFDIDGLTYPIQLEMLLARKDKIPLPTAMELIEGKRKGTISPENKKFLLDAMKAVGWRIDESQLYEKFWDDVIIVSLGGRDVPIISDPSALTSYLVVDHGVNMLPPNTSRNSQKLNACYKDYPTLQNQAAEYNAIIHGENSDSRLKVLVPELVDFEKTTVLQEPVKPGEGPPKPGRHRRREGSQDSHHRQ